MSICLTMATNDPTYRSALAHPKSTPVVERRSLQLVAAMFRLQAEELKQFWAELPQADRDWWVAWAGDELPKASLGETLLGFLFGCLTLLNMVLHRDDALEVLTSARMLRQTVFDLRSKDVWDAALSDREFVEASARGFDDLASGRVTNVALKDL